jgi:hypothetical protein
MMGVRTRKRFEFALYPEEQRWWSFADYGAVLEVMVRLQPRRILEFGPGSSTLALVEGGADLIDTCEDEPTWAEVYEERLVKRFPGLVRLHRYVYYDPIVIPSLADRTYDMALIDGPHGTQTRRAPLVFALKRCAAVLMATEDCRPGHQSLRPLIAEEACRHDVEIEWMETGPTSGGFALLRKRAA